MSVWLGVAAAILILRGRRLPRPSLPIGRGPREDDLLSAARLLALCLSAGVPLSLALDEVRREASDRLRPEIDRVLRAARASGLAQAMVAAGGNLEPLASVLARAQLTGAPMAAAVREFVRSRRAEARHRALESARVLPVKLIVPIALFLLPGFVALVMGPTIVEQVGGLGLVGM